MRIGMMLAAAGVVVVLSVGTAIAADDQVAAAPVEKTQPEKKAGNPYLPRLEKKTKELGDKIDKDAQEHLYFVREGYGVTRAVAIVRRDVSTAVKACGKANPDMKTEIDSRFESWTEKVDPVMQEKQGEIDAAIDGQTYLKPKEVRDYLKLIEQAGDYANKAIDKEVVTTPDACNSLLKSMDRTEDVVRKLLSKLAFLPWPPVEGGGDPPPQKIITPN